MGEGNRQGDVDELQWERNTMKKTKGLFVLAILMGLALSGYCIAEDKAEPGEIVKKVQDAASVLAKSGEAGLAEFNKTDGPWVWKDTYVFVYNCEQGTIAAHPTSPHLIGKNMTGLKDIKGNLFFGQLCDAARKPKGGWIEYWWPKPGEKEPLRKISFMLQAQGTPYQVGAGIYEDAVSVQDLEKSIQ